MGQHTKDFQHVQYLWKDQEAEPLRGVDRLVYRSNKLGEDLTLTNTGGGNTSSKLMEKDPLSGSQVEVLWVKGSGGDLRTANRDGFASLYLDRVRAMSTTWMFCSTTMSPDSSRYQTQFLSRSSSGVLTARAGRSICGQ